MATPRTIAGRAALSGMRPYLKRALGRTITTIEEEAIAPYLDALRDADSVLAELAAWDAPSSGDAAARSDLVKRAEAARQLAMPLLAERPSEDPG